MEIEAAGDEYADRSALLAQCRELMEAFGIEQKDLIADSYSDLLVKVVSGR
jgi:adenylate cyclase class IV